MSKNIRIVSPAKAISADLIDNAVKLLSEAGHHVSVGQHATSQHHYFSGTVQERLVDFQNAIDDPSIDVILCARGGYGCIQIIDELDFSGLISLNKLIVGFSDITVFHIHCHHLGLPTVHATMPLNFAKNSEASINSLFKAIDHKANKYEMLPNKFNKIGTAKAEVIGGNLATIQTLVGTNSDFNFTDKILFIEDVSEYVYTIDRMLWNLKKAGKLKNLAGLIVGGMTGIKDTEVPFGNTVEELISQHVSEFDFPVCFDFPAGHIDDNRAITFGKLSVLKVKKNIAVLVN
ncbi:MAG: LD-carboxypeptidase [Crocinitomicaceae bacterium]